MNAALNMLLRGLRRRLWLSALLPCLPWLAAVLFLLSAQTAPVFALIAGLGLLTCLGWHSHSVHQGLRRTNMPWLLRRLDGLRSELEDSAELILAAPRDLSPVQALQREHVLKRLSATALPDLRHPLPWRQTLIASALALVTAGLPWLLPIAPTTPSAEGEQSVEAAAVAQAIDARISVSPPGYTGLGSRQSDQLATEVVENSRLVWSLQFALPPSTARLVFVDGEIVPLSLIQGRFEAERILADSTLYRVEVEGAPAVDAALHRIDVLKDRPPQLTVIAPERTLTVIESEQRQWDIRIDAEDDYGLGKAELVLALAQGSGEQVTVNEQRIRLDGDGKSTRRHFHRLLNLATLGYGRGDDLIARLEVQDNRQPQAQTARSPALILRWPDKPSAEGSGVEGLVQRTLPAYFRSQRQIIIDTEALIAERRRIDQSTLLARSDALGVDQRILRMRYGQFLGEESEAGDLPGSGPAHSDADRAHDDDEDGHESADDHDHNERGGSVPAFGEAGGLLAEVGHLHDIAEAATLLDPRTKSLLRAALNEMWQAEGELRLGKPVAALPFEYRALDLIKQVQQSNRIYLARVGLELPQVDFTRRLTGEDRPTRLAGTQLLNSRDAGPPLATWWQALDRAEDLPLQALSDWLATSPSSLPDALGALAELDALRRNPDCTPCRQRLQQQLWPALPVPRAAPMPRPDGGQVGAHYLQALEPAP